MTSDMSDHIQEGECIMDCMGCGERIQANEVSVYARGTSWHANCPSEYETEERLEDED